MSRHCHFCVFQLQNVQVNENVTEDERRFELWYASATSEKYTLQVRNLATKQAWLKDTRELLKALGQSLSGGMDHTLFACISPTFDSYWCLLHTRCLSNVVTRVQLLVVSFSVSFFTENIHELWMYLHFPKTKQLQQQESHQEWFTFAFSLGWWRVTGII